MARTLNAFMAELARAHPELVALGTVLPGEPDADAIVDEALALGLRGFKIHCHVQKLGPDDPRLDPVYARAAAAGVPVVIHSGRQPCLAAYGVDIERHLLGRRHPPRARAPPEAHHDRPAPRRRRGGAPTSRSSTEFPNLYLDTTMMVGEYFDRRIDPALLERHADRVLYGTDFPNIPYEWDRELAGSRRASRRPRAQRFSAATPLVSFASTDRTTATVFVGNCDSGVPSARNIAVAAAPSTSCPRVIHTSLSCFTADHNSAHSVVHKLKCSRTFNEAFFAIRRAWHDPRKVIGSENGWRLG